MRRLVAFLPSVTLSFVAAQAWAGVCDYKPSALFGVAVTTTIGTTAAATGTVGTLASAAGFYTLTHATSGLTMLASTAIGTSAAGTAGIIGGTGGLIGTVSAIVMAPTTIIVAGVATVGIGAYEGACVFAVDRITDPDEIHVLMQHLAEQAKPEFFRLTNLVDGRAGIFVRDGDTVAIYAIADLYLADGALKHEEWLRDTTDWRFELGGVAA